MRRLLIFIILLFQFCSYENPYIARIKGDYFPIDKMGNFWKFRNKNDSEKYLEVKGTKVIDGREAVILEENYEETYWYKGEGFLSRFRDIEINFNGELFHVEKRWQHYIEVPIVKGNFWADFWEDTLSFYNQPLYKTDNLSGIVEGFETIKIEAGTFKNCYRIKFHLVEEISSIITGDSISEKTYYEWYAPDVGLVKSTEDDENWELIDYGNKEEGE
ncbi:MAG: hypothetical protein E3J87_09335 [Candidatus Cloacimonadota bacterium]|nr:MAG: hypothetical protein E3J87_09335 [Candidatus Cloacimonadota bacterium]